MFFCVFKSVNFTTTLAFPLFYDDFGFSPGLDIHTDPIDFGLPSGLEIEVNAIDLGFETGHGNGEEKTIHGV